MASPRLRVLNWKQTTPIKSLDYIQEVCNSRGKSVRLRYYVCLSTHHTNLLIHWACSPPWWENVLQNRERDTTVLTNSFLPRVLENKQIISQTSGCILRKLKRNDEVLWQLANQKMSAFHSSIDEETVLNRSNCQQSILITWFNP